MAFIKCIDCGKIYDTGLEACPQCGCPTEQQQLPPIVDSDDNTPIDVTSIFYIKEDKFEETKKVYVGSRKKTSTSIDDLCKSLHVSSPDIHLHYFLDFNVGSGRVYIVFLWSEFEEIEKNNDNKLVADHCSPCKRMIINIDDRENIRLESKEDEAGFGLFPITQDVFLKCCNAKKLEFKITMENGEYIVVNGYYKIDPDTGAEIDENGDVVPENDLILNFQALYNYVIDPNMFKDALRRRQMWDNWIKEKNQTKREEATREVKYEKQRNKDIGVVWVVIGVLTLIIGIILLVHGISVNDKSTSLDAGVGSMVIGVCMLFIGLYIGVYGEKRIRGLKSRDAINEMINQMGGN